MEKIDQEYAIYAGSFGDGTPLSFEDWKKARECVEGEVPSNLTAEDVAYIKYMSQYGDGTPKSFEEWKEAGKP